MGWDLVTQKAIAYNLYQIFISIKPFSDLLCPMDGGRVILEETTPIKIEMFQNYLSL